LSSSLSSRTATEFGLCSLTLVTLARIACFTYSFVLRICDGCILIKTLNQRDDERSTAGINLSKRKRAAFDERHAWEDD